MKFFTGDILKNLQAKKKLSNSEKLTISELDKLYNASFLLVPTKGETPGKYNFKNTVNNPASIAALAAGGVELKNYKDMLAIYREFPYSSWNNVSQKEHANLSSMVPIPLTAMKDRYDIKYSEWDFDNTAASYGMFLASTHKKSLDIVETAYDAVKEMYERLEEMLKGQDVLAWARQHTTNKHSPNKFPQSETYADFVTLWNRPLGNTNFSRLCRVCLLQVWLAGDIRIPGKTVLNPFDWDKVPEYIPPRPMLNTMEDL